MAQRPRLSTLVCDSVEETESCWQEVMEQVRTRGRIDPDLAGEMTRRLAASVILAADNDEAQAIAAAMLKCGPDSAQVGRLMAERRQRKECEERRRQRRMRLVRGGEGKVA